MALKRHPAKYFDSSMKLQLESLLISLKESQTSSSLWQLKDRDSSNNIQTRAAAIVAGTSAEVSAVALQHDWHVSQMYLPWQRRQRFCSALAADGYM